MIHFSFSVLPPEMSTELIRYSHRARITVRSVTSALMIALIVFFSGFNVFYTNAIYLVSLHSMAYWLVAFPIYIGHVIYGNEVKCRVLRRKQMSLAADFTMILSYTCHPIRGGTNQIVRTNFCIARTDDSLTLREGFIEALPKLVRTI